MAAGRSTRWLKWHHASLPCTRSGGSMRAFNRLPCAAQQLNKPRYRARCTAVIVRHGMRSGGDTVLSASPATHTTPIQLASYGPR
jgi:hypothetical protein